jgi:hypothetical protein
VTVTRLRGIEEVLDRARSGWADHGEVTLDAGVDYTDGKPVRIRVRKRLHRYDFDDEGGAVALAGKPSGWHEMAERVVAREGFNVNRAGVVFVQAVESRPLAALAVRLAYCSAAVFATLLELSE